MLVTMNEMLKSARDQGYGVGFFNAVTLTMVQGVLDAAQALRAPVMIGTGEALLHLASLEESIDLLLPMAKRAEVPVVVHLDHGLTEEVVYQAMDLGFGSVMYDCSTKSYEENVSAVARLVKDAHARGITVEGELGHVAMGSDSPEDISSLYTDPVQAVDFVKRTQVDALAVAIGTAHGPYAVAPKLDFERLQALRAAVPVPLVLHGGSGLTDEDFRRSVTEGIAKINIFTDINVACVKGIVETYREGMGIIDVLPAARAAVRNATEEKLKLFGCAGKA